MKFKSLQTRNDSGKRLSALASGAEQTARQRADTKNDILNVTPAQAGVHAEI